MVWETDSSLSSIDSLASVTSTEITNEVTPTDGGYEADISSSEDEL